MNGDFDVKAAMRRLFRKEARREHKRRSHDGKIAYPTEREAAAVAAGLERCYPNERFNAYKCEHCPAWHVGHVPLWKLKKEAANGERQHNDS